MSGAESAPEHSTNSGDGRKAEKTRAQTGLDLAVEHRPVEALIPYARNARTHSDAQVAEIAASIREFGWTNPILVDGDNGIIAGHGRLLAARKLGLATVPVIELAGLTEAEQRAYVLADNKLALNAGWDEAMLALEIADLNALGFDLSLAGFGEREIDRLIDLVQRTPPSFPDEAPAPPESRSPVRATSGCWASTGCSAATPRSSEDVRTALGGRLADMVFTDPPYNVAYEGKTAKKLTIANDALGAEFGGVPRGSPAERCSRSPRARSTSACRRPRSAR